MIISFLDSESAINLKRCNKYAAIRVGREQVKYVYPVMIVHDWVCTDEFDGCGYYDYNYNSMTAHLIRLHTVLRCNSLYLQFGAHLKSYSSQTKKNMLIVQLQYQSRGIRPKDGKNAFDYFWKGDENKLFVSRNDNSFVEPRNYCMHCFDNKNIKRPGFLLLNTDKLYVLEDANNEKQIDGFKINQTTCRHI